MVHLTQPRLIRLTLGILVPPLAMALCYVAINTWLWGLNMGLAIGWLTFTQAFSLATIQLLTYSLLMEFLVVPNLRNIHAVAVVSGLLLVVTVVSAFVLFFGIDVSPFANDQLTPSLGFIIGCLLGYGLKLNTQKQRKRALGSQET